MWRRKWERETCATKRTERQRTRKVSQRNYKELTRRLLGRKKRPAASLVSLPRSEEFFGPSRWVLGFDSWSPSITENAPNPRRKFPCNMSHFPQGMKVHILRTYKHGQKRVPDALWKGEMTEHVLLVEMRCHRRRPDASQITRYFEKLVPDLWHAYLVSKHASRNCYLVPCLFIHETHGQYTYMN